MNRIFVTMSVVVACAAPGTGRGAALAPPAQAYVLELAFAQAFFPTSPLLDLSPNYTIEFWIMHEDNSPGAFLAKPLPGGTGVYLFVVESSGAVTYGQGTGTPQSYSQITSPVTVPAHVWAHIAATSDGTTVRLYVNGADVADMPSPGPPQNVTTIPLQLGFGSSRADAIRQLRFWNVALTPQQLAVSAGSRLYGHEPGLVADWPFEDGAVGVAHDIGPNHLDLPLPGVGDYSPPYPNMRWIHSAVLDAGPFFSSEGPFSATSLNGTQFFLAAAALVHLGAPGVPDVVAQAQAWDPNVPGPLVVLRNDGTGHFSDQTAATFGGAAPTSFGARDIVVADYDGDGRDDVFVPVIGEGRTPNWGGQNHLLLQFAAGELTDVTSTNLPQVEAYAYTARAADVDGSGHQEIYVDNIHFSQVVPPLGPLFLDNDGTGHFTMDQTRLPSDFLEPEPDGSHWMVGVFIDSRRLGPPNLVACCSLVQSGPQTDTLLLNDGHGHFSEAPAGTMPITLPRFVTVEMATGDFDGDGWDDIVEEGNSNSNPTVDGGTSMRVVLNNHDGTFREAPGAIPSAGNHEIEFDLLGPMHVADFNGDGKPDVLVEAQQPLLFLNTGGGHFIDGSEILPLDFLALGGVKYLAADLDGNGSVDLIALGANGQKFTVARQRKAVSINLFERVGGGRVGRHLQRAGH